MTTKPPRIWSFACRKSLILLVPFQLLPFFLRAQKDHAGFWTIPDTLDKTRLGIAIGAGTVAYGGTLLALNGLWYDNYERSSFHLFNDRKEWLQMDKAGHMFTTYFESEWCYHIARWTGMKRKPAIWTGTLIATGLQTTIEVFDGFSSKWGFSLSDMAFNIFGAALWTSQQLVWNEQRFQMKVSTTYRVYPADPIAGMPSGYSSLRRRAEDLFGRNLFQTFLKDYNAQTIWLSVNPRSFMGKNSRFPAWLNVAIGYGAENMFGGFGNTWEEAGNTFTLTEQQYPRYRQWYVSPDVDLSRIPVRNHFLRTLLGMANVFKIPAPALEINGRGKIKWIWLHY